MRRGWTVSVAGRTSPDRTSIPLAELRDRPLISLPRGTGIRGVLDRAYAQAGFQPHIAFEAAAPLFLAQLAARGLGVAVVRPCPPARRQPSGYGLGRSPSRGYAAGSR
ncbi:MULTISPECIES: LysR substrate-binding domain-containing protein [unclassified Streptomyces]|uniref:LysR substrate-binding domain-containing protein n=1 Tax=unclassified Streptomyces TaxID=2593676 RepID=UPI0036B0290A